MKYISEVNGVTFGQLYEHGFVEFLQEFGITEI